jgi:sugar-phosphatase
MPAIRCNAILFDLDGVLVDSGECVEKTWRRWALDHRLDPDVVVEAAHGRRAIETVRLVAPELRADDELVRLARSESTTSEGIHEIPGARDLVLGIPDGLWGVVTSGIRAVAEFRLRLVGIPIPQVMVCGDEVTHGKPNPEGYLKAGERLGYTPRDYVVIEDAPAGIEAAHAAGMRVIGVAGTYPAELLTGADGVVAKLRALRIERDGDHLRVATIDS